MVVVLVRLDAGAHEEHEVQQEQEGAEREERLLESQESGESVSVVCVAIIWGVVGRRVVCVAGVVLNFR